MVKVINPTIKRKNPASGSRHKETCNQGSPMGRTTCPVVRKSKAIPPPQAAARPETPSRKKVAMLWRCGRLRKNSGRIAESKAVNTADSAINMAISSFTGKF
jgi:hypothetical protein